MKYEELKELVLCYLHYHSSDSCRKQIDLYFQQYEKENQATNEQLELLTGFKDGTNLVNICKELQELSAYRIKFGKCLDEMQKEIENMKGINGLNFESHSERLNIIEKKLESEPKKERFYYLNEGEFLFTVLDRNGIHCFDCSYTKLEAMEICKALNQMEGGGK